MVRDKARGRGVKQMLRRWSQNVAKFTLRNICTFPIEKKSGEICHETTSHGIVPGNAIELAWRRSPRHLAERVAVRRGRPPYFY